MLASSSERATTVRKIVLLSEPESVKSGPVVAQVSALYVSVRVVGLKIGVRGEAQAARLALDI